MRKKKGMTLKEKIDQQLQKVKKKEVVEHIDDCFFQEVEEGGSLYLVRRTNLQRDGGRTLNIPDEIEIANQEQLRAQEEEAKRDITFEEYKAKFEDHIEGRAENLRSQHDSENEEMERKEVQKPSQSNPKSKKEKTDQNKTGSNFNPDEEGEEGKSQASHAVSKSSVKKSTVDVRSTSKVDDSYKYEIPESCHVAMMKKVKIEKLSSKFLLCADPYPLIEGQMICFQPKKDDQKVKEAIIYRDYSLRKRLETQQKPEMESFGKGKAKYAKAEPKAEEPDSKLQCLEIDNENPLS